MTARYEQPPKPLSDSTAMTPFEHFVCECTVLHFQALRYATSLSGAEGLLAAVGTRGRLTDANCDLSRKLHSLEGMVRQLGVDAVFGHRSP